ncbi:MAG: tetratricopeptide repeat protein [Phycisphaerae bacterium]
MQTSTWPPCLAATATLAVAAIAQAGDAARVQSRVFEIEYDVNQQAMPLDAVQLWYTLDRAKTWHQYGYDEDRRSPMTFNAAQEGLYGFFFIVTNATGPSSAPPTSATRAHQWAFVDFTPPVVQAHRLRLTTTSGNPVMQIRWTAIDTHLPARPVRLAYATPPDTTWRPIEDDPLANTGRFDWRVPTSVTGQVVVRVTVEDRGGHRVSAETPPVDVPAPLHDAPAVLDTRSTPTTPYQRSAARDTPPAAQNRRSPDHYARLATTRGQDARAQAARLLAEGLADRDAGRYRQGIGRLRDAIRLDPALTQALVEMGHMLYAIDDLEPAMAAFELALRQEPSLASALRGAAMIDRRRHNYPSAVNRLRTILRYSPRDAEAWLSLGDMAIFQGDDVLAREHYLRASTIDPSAVDVVGEARRRLALMDEVRTTFEQGGGGS